jgi:hypothetical protein
VPAFSFSPDFAGPGEWAAMYRACGLQVVPAPYPMRTAAEKRPALSEWRTLHEALVTDTVFDRWYAYGTGTYHKNPNMGVICGHASDNLMVIDADQYKSATSGNWWQDVIRVHNHGIDPDTWRAKTGGGGTHRFFKAPLHWRVPTNSTALEVDIRGQGGFAMLPPSKHLSGNDYRWIEGFEPWTTELAEAPQWLLDAIDELVANHAGGGTGGTARTAHHGPDFDALGFRINGREQYMTQMVWAACVNLWRDSPILPHPADLDRLMRENYAVYELQVGTRLPGVDRDAGLEQEGRGISMFAAKWRRALSKWEGKIAEDGAIPSPNHPQPGASSAQFASAVGQIPIEPAFPIDASSIPPRDWITPGLLLRRYLSVLVAPPGSGKSVLTLHLSIANAANMEWAGWTPRKSAKTLIINAEDDGDEMRRRFYVAALAMNVSQEQLAGRILLASAPESIVIAKTDSRTKTVVRTPLLEPLIDAIVQAGVDIVIVDPFAETFEGDENSNSEVKWAGILWREVARRTGTAVLLVHHTRKYAGGMAGDADASRGGGALIGTARIVSTLFSMTEEEAAIMDVPAEQRGDYVRFDDAKANQSRVSKTARWFIKDARTLPNGNGIIPGDDVVTLVPWKPPGLFEGVSFETISLALEMIDRGVLDNDGRPTGHFYTQHSTSTNKERWAGKVVEEILGCDEDKAKTILKEWVASGVLTPFEYAEQRGGGSGPKTKTGLRYDRSKRPGRVEE